MIKLKTLHNNNKLVYIFLIKSRKQKCLYVNIQNWCDTIGGDSKGKVNIKLVSRCPIVFRHSGTFNILDIRITLHLQRPSWLLLNWTKNFFNAPKTFQLIIYLMQSKVCALIFMFLSIFFVFHLVNSVLQHPDQRFIVDPNVKYKFYISRFKF